MRVNNELETKIIQLYKNGLSTVKIANMFGLYPSTIHYHLKKCSIKIRSISEANINRVYKLDRNQIQEIIKLYQRGKIKKELSKIFRVSSSVISYHLRVNNIPFRSRVKYVLNENFFEKIDTEQKAYWLGFIAADGCMFKNKNQYLLRLALGKKDYNHLVKLNRDIESDKPIYEDKISYSLVLRSKKIFNDLIKYNIVPNKTFKLKFPRNVSGNLIKHFIRGYFDGDGGIHWHKKNKTLEVQFLGLKDFLLRIQKILVNECRINYVKIFRSRSIYCLKYVGNTQVPRILNYLYKGSNIYLDRKYEIAKQTI